MTTPQAKQRFSNIKLEKAYYIQKLKYWKSKKNSISNEILPQFKANLKGIKKILDLYVEQETFVSLDDAKKLESLFRENGLLVYHQQNK